MIMELNDIMQLVKAGFTKNEIMQMAPTAVSVTNPEPAPVGAVPPEPVPKPAPAPAPVPAEQPAPAPAPLPAEQPAQDQPTMAQIMESIAKLTSAVQANAIAQSVIPDGIMNPQKPENVLAEIIHPTYKDRK